MWINAQERGRDKRFRLERLLNRGDRPLLISSHSVTATEPDRKKSACVGLPRKLERAYPFRGGVLFPSEDCQRIRSPGVRRWLIRRDMNLLLVRRARLLRITSRLANVSLEPVCVGERHGPQPLFVVE